MPLHRLSNLEIQMYYQNYSKFSGVYSKNNSHKMKDGAYVTDLDEFTSKIVEYLYM